MAEFILGLLFIIGICKLFEYVFHSGKTGKSITIWFLEVRKKDVLFIALTYFFWPVLFVCYFVFGFVDVIWLQERWLLIIIIFLFSPVTSIAFTFGFCIFYLSSIKSWSTRLYPFISMWLTWVISFVLFNVVYYVYCYEFPVKYFISINQFVRSPEDNEK